MGFDFGIGETAAALTAGTAVETVTPAVAAADAAATTAGASYVGASVLPSFGSFASAAAIGSSAISALGSIQQSRSSAAAAGYNAQIAQENAQIQTQNAQFAGSVGEQEVGQAGARTKAAIGATLANEGASGVDIGSGSNVDVRQSEAKLGLLNAFTLRSNAAKQAYGFQVGATSDTAQAALDKSQQKSDTTGGYLAAGANVLGGISNAAKYNNWLNKTSPVGSF